VTNDGRQQSKRLSTTSLNLRTITPNLNDCLPLSMSVQVIVETNVNLQTIIREEKHKNPDAALKT
jgi:hypothetical protein